MKISSTAKTIWSRDSQHKYYGNYVKGFLPTTGKAEICVKAEKEDSSRNSQDEATILFGVGLLDQSPSTLDKMYLFRSYYGKFVGGAGKEVQLRPVRQYGKHIRLVYDANAFALQLFVNGLNFSYLLPLNLNIIESKEHLRFFVASSEHESVSLVPSSNIVCKRYVSLFYYVPVSRTSQSE